MERDMWFVRLIGFAVAGLAMCAASAAVKADVVVVVATSSPVKALARNQVADIFPRQDQSFPRRRTGYSH
nr:hypothetical protein GCM10020185_83650 [Pseudomonas brassicacearum subsp. brassicacearum]